MDCVPIRKCTQKWWLMIVEGMYREWLVPHILEVKSVLVKGEQWFFKWKFCETQCESRGEDWGGVLRRLWRAGARSRGCAGCWAGCWSRGHAAEGCMAGAGALQRLLGSAVRCWWPPCPGVSSLSSGAAAWAELGCLGSRPSSAVSCVGLSEVT